MAKKEKTECVICGNSIVGYGHNPYPIKKKGRCCNLCNDKVIQERLNQITKYYSPKGLNIGWKIRSNHRGGLNE